MEKHTKIIVREIDDELIGECINRYKDYLAYIRTSQPSFIDDDCKATECTKKGNDMWNAWYKPFCDVVHNIHNCHLPAIMLAANENKLTVNNIHHCIEVLGINIERVDYYD